MTVGSLFSGIGGIELGLERAGMRVVWQCEADADRREVLRHWWPNVPCFKDVRDIDPDTIMGNRPDGICGGFPCQPVSNPGKRLGEEDSRWLWPEFARVILLLRPCWVLVENVPGLYSRGMGTVLGDLAAMGYDSEWSCISAATFGAPHLRERVWIVADSDHGRRNRRVSTGTPQIFTQRAFERPDRWEAEPAFPRVDDGVPGAVVRAAGDAVVPQVAEWIGKRILEAEAA